MNAEEFEKAEYELSNAIIHRKGEITDNRNFSFEVSHLVSDTGYSWIFNRVTLNAIQEHMNIYETPTVLVREEFLLRCLASKCCKNLNDNQKLESHFKAMQEILVRNFKMENFFELLLLNEVAEMSVNESMCSEISKTTLFSIIQRLETSIATTQTTMLKAQIEKSKVITTLLQELRNAFMHTSIDLQPHSNELIPFVLQGFDFMQKPYPINVYDVFTYGSFVSKCKSCLRKFNETVEKYISALCVRMSVFSDESGVAIKPAYFPKDEFQKHIRLIFEKLTPDIFTKLLLDFVSLLESILPEFDPRIMDFANVHPIDIEPEFNEFGLCNVYINEIIEKSKMKKCSKEQLFSGNSFLRDSLWHFRLRRNSDSGNFEKDGKQELATDLIKFVERFLNSSGMITIADIVYIFCQMKYHKGKLKDIIPTLEQVVNFELIRPTSMVIWSKEMEMFVDDNVKFEISDSSLDCIVVPSVFHALYLLANVYKLLRDEESYSQTINKYKQVCDFLGANSPISHALFWYARHLDAASLEENDFEMD